MLCKKKIKGFTIADVGAYLINMTTRWWVGFILAALNRSNAW